MVYVLERGSHITAHCVREGYFPTLVRTKCSQILKLTIPCGQVVELWYTDSASIKPYYDLHGVDRCSRYLNNRIEQDHRGIKGRSRPMRGFGAFKSAARLCSAHDEVRDYFRHRTRMDEVVPLGCSGSSSAAGWTTCGQCCRWRRRIIGSNHTVPRTSAVPVGHLVLWNLTRP